MNKKVKGGFIIGFSVLMFGALISCGEKPVVSVNPIDENEIDNNLSSLVPSEEESIVKEKISGTNFQATFAQKYIVSDSYMKNGLLVVKNSSDHVGFYSLEYGKYLINPMFNQAWLNYEIHENAQVGYTLWVKYNGVRSVYDSMGNILYEGEAEPTVSFSGKEYVTVAYYTLDEDESRVYTEKYYKYVNGKLTEATFVPYETDSTVTEKESTETKESEFTTYQKSEYVDIEKIDLTKYGKPGFYLSRCNNLYTLFDSSNNPVKTFSLPENAISVIIGDYIIYQESNELPEDSSDYAYYVDGGKYSLITHRINISTGETEKLSVNYRIEDFISYKDSDGNYTYAFAAAEAVNEDKTLSGEVSYIIDDSATIIKDLTGYEAMSFIKLDNSYYNLVTEILYDSSMQEIAYLGGMNPVLRESDGIFTGTVNGKYGAVDFNGLIAIPFEYDSIYPTITNKNAICHKNDTYYRVDYSTNKIQRLGSTFVQLNSNLYYSSSDSFVKYLTIDKDYETFEGNYTIVGHGEDTMLYNQGDYFFGEIYEKDKNEKTFICFDIQKLTNGTISSLGTENTVREAIGEKITDAVTLKIGEDNNVNTTNTIGNYFVFNPTEDGYYSFDLENSSASVLYVYYYNPLNGEYDKLPFDSSTSDSTVYMDKNYTYYYFVKMNGKDYSEGNVSKERGQSEDYPRRLSLTDEKTYTLTTPYDKTYYLFEAPATMTYTVSASDGYTVFYDGEPITSLDVTAGQTYELCLANEKNLTTAKLTMDYGIQYSGDYYNKDDCKLSDEKEIDIGNRASYYLSYTNTSNYQEFKILTEGLSAYYTLSVENEDGEYEAVSSNYQFRLKSNETVNFCITSKVNEVLTVKAVIQPMNTVNITGYKAAKVTFDSVGGSEVETQYLSRFNTTLSAPEDPVKEGYIFSGWYKDQNYTEVYEFDESISEDMTLYAKWTALVNENCAVINAADYNTSANPVQLTLDDELGLPHYFCFRVNQAGTYRIHYTKSSGYDLYIYNATTGKAILDNMSFNQHNYVGFTADTNDIIVIRFFINSSSSISTSYYFEGMREVVSTAIFDETNAVSETYSINSYVTKDTVLSYYEPDGKTFAGYYDENMDQITDENGIILKDITPGQTLNLTAYYKEETGMLLSSAYENYLINWDVNRADLTFTALETTTYSFSATGNTRIVTEEGETLSQLNTVKGQEYKIIVLSPENLNTTLTITADTTGLTEGKSCYLPTALDANTDITITASTSDVVYNYYIYTNNVAETQNLRIDGTVTNGSAEVYAETDGFTASPSLANGTYTLAPGEKLYVCVKATPNIFNNIEMSFTVKTLYTVTVQGVYKATVTFETGDEASLVDSQTIINDGSKLTIPEDPTWEGHIFDGWYKDSELTELFDFDENITCDTTLYAKWVELDTDEAVNFIINPMDYSSSTSYLGISLSGSAKYVYFRVNKTGTYSLSYRSYSSSTYYAINVSAADITSGESLHTYTGYRSTSYNTVSFTAAENDIICITLSNYYSYYSTSAYLYFNGFTANVSTTELNPVNCALNSYLLTIEDRLTFPTFTKEGYKFIGYYDSETEGTQITDESGLMITGATKDMTLYPIYKAPVTVTFISETTEYTTQTVIYGENAAEPTKPTKEGYGFAGWYTDSEYTQEFDFSTPLIEDITLYALFKEQ